MTTRGSSHLVYPLLKKIVAVVDGTCCAVPEVTLFNACYPTESEVEILEMRMLDLAADARDLNITAWTSAFRLAEATDEMKTIDRV